MTSLEEVIIRITCPCNVYPPEPHFYTAKLGYAGVYQIFLFLLQNIDCGYSLEPPRIFFFWSFEISEGISGANIMGYLSRGWSMEYHICFYIPKCSYWSVVLKSSVCHLCKPCITPVFKMASKMAAIS